MTVHEFRRIHDVSAVIGPRLPVYEGDPKPEVEKLTDTDPFVTSRLTMSAHTGTHVDAPAHIVAGGRGVDEIPLDALVGPARVVSPDTDVIDAGTVERMGAQPGERLLFRTRNSGLLTDPAFRKDFVHITEDGARALVDARVRTVGIDYLSVERFHGSGDTHRALLEANIAVIEGLDLSGVNAGTYTLVCLPLKVEGADGAPARAILLEPQET